MLVRSIHKPAHKYLAVGLHQDSGGCRKRSADIGRHQATCTEGSVQLAVGREPRYGKLLCPIKGKRCRPHHDDVAVGLYRHGSRAIDAVREKCRPRSPNQRPIRRVPHESKILLVGNAVAESGDYCDVTIRLLNGGQRTNADAAEVGRYYSTYT